MTETPDTTQQQATTIEQPKAKAIPFAHMMACRFFAEGLGKMATDHESGLEIFSPSTIPNVQSNVFFIETGKQTLAENAKKLHVMMIKTVPDASKIGWDGRPLSFRRDCKTFKPVITGRDHWWSVLGVQYGTPEERDYAINKFNSAIGLDPNDEPVVLKMDELQKWIEGLDKPLIITANGVTYDSGDPKTALKTLKVLSELRIDQEKCMPHLLNRMPHRFNLKSMALVYFTSSTQGPEITDENGVKQFKIWTNLRVQERQQQRQPNQGQGQANQRQPYASAPDTSGID